MPRKSHFLLTRFPTLWNLKVHYALPVSLLLHIVFYAFGRFSYGSLSKMGSYSVLEPQPAVIFLSVVSSLIFLIIWLNAYFKNNALKLKLPKNYLNSRTQILWFVLLFTLNGSYFISYIHGIQIKYKVLAQSIDFETMVEDYNIGHYFLPFNLHHYDIGQSCDSIDFSKWEYSPNQYDKGSQLYHYQHNLKYYCGIPFRKHIRNEDKELALQLLRNKALLLMYNKDKEGIQKVIDRYIIHVRTFGGTARFSSDKYVDTLILQNFEIFDEISSYDHTSYYGYKPNYDGELDVTEAVEEFEVLSNSDGRVIENRFIQTRNFELGLDNTYKSLQYQYPDFVLFSPFFLILLFLSLIILMFKLTSIRVGFISLVSLGILFFLTTLLALLISAAALDWVIVFLIIIGFLAWFLQKKWAGVCATLFVWMMPFWHLLIVSSNFFKSSSNTIEENIKTFNLIQIGITLLIFLIVVIPFVLRWQSMPEE